VLWQKALQLSSTLQSFQLESQPMSGGQARLPHLGDLVIRSVKSLLERLSLKNKRLNTDELMVGKVGLPPLVCQHSRLPLPSLLDQRFRQPFTPAAAALSRR
jgi:hypothetical protein